MSDRHAVCARVAAAIRRVSFGAAMVLALGACSVDEDANPGFKNCKVDDDCGRNMRCRRGYCYRDGSSGSGGTGGSTPDDGGARDGGGMDGGGGDGGVEAPEPCTPAEGEELATEFCYTGPEDTALEGTCKAGERTCFPDESSPMGGFWGPCTGEILPAEHELCNGKDDDCDGTTDEVASFADCSTHMLGLCMVGRVICDRGSAICAVITTPSVEECDGEDNDCDGKTDEGNMAQASCYTAAAGCEDANGDGEFECLGVCRPGVRQCTDGVIGACTGMIGPAAMEDCELNEQDVADDDDCDGKIDEGCTCIASEQRFCYSGPAGTHENAPCMRGTQTCNASGQWEEECDGEVLPVEETCANQGSDDDCDGVPDDVPMLGVACDNPDENAMGRCATGVRECVSGTLQCVTPEPRDETCDNTDDDCSGGVDEGFNLQNDEQNCGECGRVCSGATPTCCEGMCVNTNTDERYCGGCGTERRCGSNLTCCGGNCVDTAVNLQHCGGCGMVCSGVAPCCRAGSCRALACL